MFYVEYRDGRKWRSTDEFDTEDDAQMEAEWLEERGYTDVTVQPGHDSLRADTIAEFND